MNCVPARGAADQFQDWLHHGDHTQRLSTNEKEPAPTQDGIEAAAYDSENDEFVSKLGSLYPARAMARHGECILGN